MNRRPSTISAKAVTGRRAFVRVAATCGGSFGGCWGGGSDGYLTAHLNATHGAAVKCQLGLLQHEDRLHPGEGGA